MVKRYRITSDGEREHPNGDFVHWQDYHALRAELEQVKRERDAQLIETQSAWNERDGEKRKRINAERLAGARRVAVKPLEWEDAVSDLIGPDIYFSRAVTAFGSYRTEQRLAGKWAMTTPNGDGICDVSGNIIHHDSLEAAKSAAQDDYERRILSALAEPAGDAEPRQFLPMEDGEFNGNTTDTPIAAEDGREVDWVDVTGWAVFKGHAIPVDVARYIADKINLYAEHRATPPDASAIREALERLVKLRKDTVSDVATAHKLRGNGASDWMREDDRDFRRDLNSAFDAAEAALAGAKP